MSEYSTEIESSEEEKPSAASPRSGKRESNFGAFANRGSLAPQSAGSPGSKRGSFQGVDSKRESLQSFSSPASKRDSVPRNFAALDPKRSFTSGQNETSITPQVFAPELATLPSSRSPHHDSSKTFESRKGSALNSSYRDEPGIGRRASIAALSSSQRITSTVTAEPPLSPERRGSMSALSSSIVKKDLANPQSSAALNSSAKEAPKSPNKMTSFTKLDSSSKESQSGTLKKQPISANASMSSKQDEAEVSPKQAENVLTLSAGLHRASDSRKSSFDVGESELSVQRSEPSKASEPPAAKKPDKKPSAAVLSLLNLDENGQPLEPKAATAFSSKRQDPPFLEVSHRSSAASSRRDSEQSYSSSKNSTVSAKPEMHPAGQEVRRESASSAQRHDSGRRASDFWGEKKIVELTQKSSIVGMVQQQQQKLQRIREESESPTESSPSSGYAVPEMNIITGNENRRSFTIDAPKSPAPSQSQVSSPASLMKERQQTAPMGIDLDAGLVQQLQAHSSVTTDSTPDSGSHISYMPMSGTNSKSAADDLLNDIQKLQEESLHIRRVASALDPLLTISSMFEFLKIDISSPHVLFAGAAQRWSSNQRSEKKLRRLVLVTQHALYTWADVGTLQRCIPVRRIDKILVGEDGWVGLGIPLEFDLLLKFTAGTTDGFVKSIAASHPPSLYISIEKSVTSIIPEISLGRPRGWALNPDSVVPIVPTAIEQPVQETSGGIHVRSPQGKAQYIDIGRLLWQPSVGAIPLVTSQAPIVTLGGTSVAPSE